MPKANKMIEEIYGIFNFNFCDKMECESLYPEYESIKWNIPSRMGQRNKEYPSSASAKAAVEASIATPNPPIKAAVKLFDITRFSGENADINDKVKNIKAHKRLHWASDMVPNSRSPINIATELRMYAIIPIRINMLILILHFAIPRAYPRQKPSKLTLKIVIKDIIENKKSPLFIL